MKLKYLGTAAYEGIPAIFCKCETCKKSRQAGGRNIRTRSQAIIDDCLLIDFPPDTFIHSLIYGIDLADVKTCIITHDHSDHYYPADFTARTPGYGVVDEDSVFTIYGTTPTIEKFHYIEAKDRWSAGKYLDAKQVTPFVPFEVEGYKITPLKASHAPYCEPVFYAIEKNGKGILYAHDTGYFPEETWEYLKAMDCCFGLVSLDCTGYIFPWREGHMGIEACIDVKSRLMEMDKCKEDTTFCLNHFSHNGGKTYDELVQEAGEKGFEVAYDGMEIIF